MLDEKTFRNIILIVLIAGLFILAVLIIRPIIIPIIFAVLLTYIFYPCYIWVLSKIKNESMSALAICIALLLIILIPIILIFKALINQAIELYLSMQNVSLTAIFQKILPTFLSQSEMSTTLSGSLSSLLTQVLTSGIQTFTNFILNLPVNLLKLFVVIFVFFFGLRDGKKVLLYLRSLSPLSKDTEKQFFKQFKDVTYSVLVGQIIIGILQGIIAGIGYFIFGVPNALLLALLTSLVGVIPLIGPWLVWVPIDLYLFASGNTGAGIGLLIYGLVVISWLDTIIRPLIVSRRTKINSAIVIIGMIGGLFVFGVLGLIIGPLVLAYILLIVEIYRKSKTTENILFEQEKK